MSVNSIFDFLSETEKGIPPRVRLLILLLDTSSCMNGTKIASLDTAIRELLIDVAAMSHNLEEQFKIAVLGISNEANWMYSMPINIDDFVLKNLKADGVPNFGNAFAELNRKLSRSHGFMTDLAYYPPIIILFSCEGLAGEYRHELDNIKRNRWYNLSIRIAIAIGDESDRQSLGEFTNDMKNVLTVHDYDKLMKSIQLSQMNTQPFVSLN